jgi:hypothetical protein
VNVISDRYAVAGMAVPVGTFAGTRISSLEIETLEIGAKLVGQVGARQREFYGGLEESQLLPVSCRLPSNSTA